MLIQAPSVGPFSVFKVFIYWLCWVFVAAHGLSLVAESRGYSLPVVHRLLTAGAALIAEYGFQSLRAQ